MNYHEKKYKTHVVFFWCSTDEYFPKTPKDRDIGCRNIMNAKMNEWTYAVPVIYELISNMNANQFNVLMLKNDEHTNKTFVHEQINSNDLNSTHMRTFIHKKETNRRHKTIANQTMNTITNNTHLSIHTQTNPLGDWQRQRKQKNWCVAVKSTNASW